jgi:polar amino acid transport system substrate-binding protein
MNSKGYLTAAVIILILLLASFAHTDKSSMSDQLPRNADKDQAVAGKSVSMTRDKEAAEIPLDGVRIPGSEIDRIRRRGYIVVSIINQERPPFCFTKNGKLIGFDLFLAEKIAYHLGVKLVISRKEKTHNGVIREVAVGNSDIGLSKLSRTKDRAAVVQFSRPYIKAYHAILLNRVEIAQRLMKNPGLSEADLIKNFTGRMGIIRATSFVEFAKKEYFPKAEIVEYNDWDECINANIRGETFATYRDDIEIKRLIRGRPDVLLTLKTFIIKDLDDDKAIAVKWNSTHLKEWLNLFLEQMNLPINAEKLLDKYPEIFKNRF